MRVVPVLTLATLLAGAVMAGPASAQLLQPRCGGWPPVPGRAGMVIGGPGEVCYGQLFSHPPSNMRLLSVTVKVPSRQASFRMIGGRDFEFSPRAGFKGIDKMVLHTEWTRDDKPFASDRVIRVTTVDEYEAAGGDRLKPPEGSNVDRRHGSKAAR